MNRAFHKDIRRSIKKGWKRFLSILIITALGVGMLTGLYAACQDMYYSADQFFDKQNLFDIRILSTLGLTQEDVEALARVDGVETVEGGYSETVYTDVNGARESAEMNVLSQRGLNMPQLLEGTMPEKAGEIAVTKKYLDESGKSIGSILTIEEVREEESEVLTFAKTTYTITGVVLDPRDIQGSDGTGTAFRFTVLSDYTFFITGADADSDMFTVIYITLAETKALNSYSDAYESKVQSVISNIESRIKTQREQARYDAVLSEAKTEITDAEKTMDEEFAEADQKFADAWRDIDEAVQELADGEAALIDEQKEAEKKIAEARGELENAKQELEKAEEQMTRSEEQLKQGEAELLEAENELKDGEKQLVQGEAELRDKAQELAEGKQQLAKEKETAFGRLDDAQQQLNEAQSRLDAARAQLEPEIAQLKGVLGDAWPENEWNALVSAAAVLTEAGADDSAVAAGTVSENAALAAAIEQINAQAAQSDVLSASAVIQLALGIGKVNGGQQELDVRKSVFAEQKTAALQELAEAEEELAAGEEQLAEAQKTMEIKKAELEAGKKQLSEERLKLEAGKVQLAEGREEWEAGKAEADDGEVKLKAEAAEAGEKIDDAWDDINDGKQELADGEAELIKEEQEYAGEKDEARQELADAYAELDDIDMTKWYVQDRTSLDSYFSLNSDLSSIEGLGRFFPVIFLLVAVLMSLTTMTRMVEEERSLIGTYKALGFGNASVYQKYLLFAATACLLGGVLGDIFGFVFMPRFISVILKELYTLPKYYLRFDVLYGIGGIVLFMAAILGATALSCRSELMQMPAVLLRPKAPRSGARVWMERIPAVWSRLKFLNKVTVRNLFRYKKRLFMTVGGIMGCTALVLCGFAIRDSVLKLAPNQYENIYRYDLMAVFEEKDNDDMIRRLTGDSNVASYLNLRIESVKARNADGESSSVQLTVLPEGSPVEDYICIEDLDGNPVNLDDDGVMITQNAAKILGLKIGDTVSVQNSELDQSEAYVSKIVQNYLGNNVYMTQKLYESMFGAYAPNGILAHLSDACADQMAYAETLLDNDSVLSAVSTAEMKESFEFELLSAVVLLLIAMAAGLALVVLFTLSNTNISERVRELATIKVLGFYDKEVYQYVNKETLILTAVGILIGLPAGRFLSGFLTVVLKMPSIHFAVYVEPVSYLLSAAITFCFAVIVNLITNRTLDRINMVEALKSIE